MNIQNPGTLQSEQFLVDMPGQGDFVFLGFSSFLAAVVKFWLVLPAPDNRCHYCDMPPHIFRAIDS
jgi:hypothetical protein